MTDRGHHAKADRHLIEKPIVLGKGPRHRSFVEYLAKVGQQGWAEIAEQDALALPMEQGRA